MQTNRSRRLSLCKTSGNKNFVQRCWEILIVVYLGFWTSQSYIVQEEDRQTSDQRYRSVQSNTSLDPLLLDSFSPVETEVGYNFTVAICVIVKDAEALATTSILLSMSASKYPSTNNISRIRSVRPLLTAKNAN